MNNEGNVSKINNAEIQKGGVIPTAAIIGLGSVAITSLLSFFLFLFYDFSDKKCLEKYPLYEKDKIPNVSEILENLIPSTWINDGIQSGKQLEGAVNDASDKLKKMRNIFSVFDDKEGSNITKGIKTTIKVGLSVGAAILTSVSYTHLTLPTIFAV